MKLRCVKLRCAESVMKLCGVCDEAALRGVCDEAALRGVCDEVALSRSLR